MSEAKHNPIDAIVKLQKECKIDLSLYERTFAVDLCYPRSEDERPNAVEVGMMCVRAADSVRVSYDFERDGWKIEQATRFCWEVDEEPDPAWKEVAFVEAWASKLPEPGDEELA